MTFGFVDQCSIQLSYGRMIDSKGLTDSTVSSNWPTVPEIVPEIAFRCFTASLGDCVTDNIPTFLMTAEKTLSASHNNEKNENRIVTWSRDGFFSLSCCSIRVPA